MRGTVKTLQEETVQTLPKPTIKMGGEILGGKIKMGGTCQRKEQFRHYQNNQ